jgi:phage FluMu protein Com
MALEIRCPGCGRTLRIAEEHAGKQVRCPACQQISTAVAATGVAREAVAPPVPEPVATWHLKTLEGPIYGPITWSEVQTWAAERRISAECELAENSTAPWRKAGILLPQLYSSPQPESIVPPEMHSWAPREPGETVGGGNPQSAPATAVAGGYVAPHRGGLILVLGLIGFVISCPIFSLMAWVMGSHDLSEMRAGRMDRSGEGITQAGLVLGMILSLLWILFGVIALLVLLVVAVLSTL